MASTIPTPAQRGQAVGTVESQFTATPFQNLNPPADVFGDGGKFAMAGAKGAADASVMLRESAEEDDKIALSNFQTDVKARQLTDTAYINSFVGKAQQDAATAKKAEFSSFISERRALDSFNYTDSKAAADDFSVLNESKFDAAVIAAYAQGSLVVNDQVNTAKLDVAAAQVAIDPTNVSVATAAINAALLDPSIGKVKTAGLNPTLINYSGTDPAKLAEKAAIERMVKEAEGALLNQVVDTLIANNRIPEALDFLTSNPSLGEGTVSRMQAQARAAPLQGSVEAGNTFRSIIKTSTEANNGDQPTISEIREVVSSMYPNDPPKQAALNQQMNTYASGRRQARTDLVNSQASLYIELIQKNEDPYSLKNVKLLSAFYESHPRLLLPERMQQVRKTQATTQAEAAWVKQGGAPISADGFYRILVGLSARSPTDFIKAIDSGNFKQFLDKGDYEDLLLTKAQAEARIETAQNGGVKPPTPGSVLNRLGLALSIRQSTLRNHSSEIRNAIEEVKTKFLETGSRPPTEAYEKAVAGVLIKVRTAEPMLGSDTYTIRGALTAAELEPEFDEYTAELSDIRSNRKLLAVVLGQTDQSIAQLFESMEGPINLNTLAKALSLPTLPDAAARLNERETAYEDAAEQGIPAEFMDFLIANLAKYKGFKDKKFSFRPSDKTESPATIVSPSELIKAFRAVPPEKQRQLLQTWGNQ